MKFCRQKNVQIKDTNFFLKQSGTFINEKKVTFWPPFNIRIKILTASDSLRSSQP